jgi:precorrin-8X/cobalt-precorrin-8 methylmutase
MYRNIKIGSEELVKMEDMARIIEVLKPADIEKRSFEIISEELKNTGVLINGNITVTDSEVNSRIMSVIKRCIHTTADFDYARTMYFSDRAIDVLEDLIRAGATIVTDTNMALSGINRRELSKYGCNAVCFMSDEAVAKEAAERELTRAHVSMEHAMKIEGDVIFALGNAPTALITLREQFDRGNYRPAFIVGVPVGFVNVTASKEMIRETGIPCILNMGRKGGSNVAAAIINAVLYGMS